MGYWKGSGISIALDLIATVLTNGNSVRKIGTFRDEIGLSQVMIAIDPSKANQTKLTDEIVNEIIADVQSSQPVQKDGKIFYPGERETMAMQDHLENGIPVDDKIRESVLAM